MHDIRRPLPRVLLAVLLYTSLLQPAPAGAGSPLSAAGCDGCHRLAPPAPGAQTLEALRERQGPDLFHAGSKYRPEWLRSWLRDPVRIRPAGVTPDLHSTTTDGDDRIEPSGLVPHPAVPPEDLDAVVAALAKLDWGSDRLPESASPVPVPRPLAEMNFVKFKGCGSCHRTAENYGGVSGPELYTAWERMRPGFLWSYVADPQAWDPVAPMPGYGLAPTEVGKLLEYLRLLSEERRDDR